MTRKSRILVLFLLVPAVWPQQQAMSTFDRDRAQNILQIVAGDVRQHYYDTKFHGVNWDAKVGEARAKIEKETSFNMAMSHIAVVLDSLNDSHTFLVPPQHAYVHDYGFQYQMVGERCFVIRVRPASDADSKGLKAGDEILTINGYTVTREDLWKMQYMFGVLRPQVGLRLQVRDPAGATRQLDVLAHMRQKKRLADLTGAGAGGDIWDLIRESETQEHLMRARYLDLGESLLVLKVPEFFFSIGEVDEMIGKARKHEALIVDLRGNPGGAIDTLKYLLGGVFDKEVKIGDRVGRKDTKAETAKALRNPFPGKIVVLVDSRSASAAELFARIVQLEKRGVVMGDHSSDSVMEAKRYSEHIGTEIAIFFGASITEWDLVMADGKSLEHVGVMPDEVALPTAQDMASGRDPVLARAAESLGVKLSAEEAGKAFPYEWPPE